MKTIEQINRVRKVEGHLVVARKKLQVVKAIAEVMADAPGAQRSTAHRLLDILNTKGNTDEHGQPDRGSDRDREAEGEAPGAESSQAAAQEVGDQARPVILGADLARGPDDTVELEHFVLSCPAGCVHAVTFPPVSTIADIIEAFERAGVRAWETKGGSFTYDVHRAVAGAGSSIAVGENVKSVAEYSEDITDPLATARKELDFIIGELDGDKAWLFSAPNGPFGPGGERDQYISSLETFMAAMLKWAQGQEQRRVDANIAVQLPCGMRTPTEAEMKAITKETEMKEKSLHNSDVNGAKKNVPDIVVYGNGDLFKLLCKASSEDEGWMKSTKVMSVGGLRQLGCLVQVTTQQRNKDGSYSVAEALTFVPQASFDDFEFPEE